MAKRPHSDPLTTVIRRQIKLSGLSDRQISEALAKQGTEVDKKTIENLRTGSNASNVRTIAALAKLFKLELVPRGSNR